MACRFNNHDTCTSRFLALIILALLAHPSKARCRPDHAAALLQLKRSSFTFTASSDGCRHVSGNKTVLSSWIKGTDCCSWEGVACDRVAGSVTGLDVAYRSLGINGSGLHPALFSLTSLKHLVLNGNDFCGSQLPASGFERLTRLEDLRLDDCNISGPIPPSFAGLRSLKTIDLSVNNFSGSTFPVGITHLKQLKVLGFQGMGLSGTIPSSIGNLSLLTELNLGGNSFSGGLPSSLSNLTYLSRLECSCSGLSGQVPSLKNSSRLEFIDLSDNNLEGNIPFSDGNVLPNLYSVDMSHNSFTGAIRALFPQPALEYLDLSYNHFTGTIRASIFTLPALEHLDLSYNHLSGHIEEFQDPSAVLNEIYLHNSNVSGAIPSSFSQFNEDASLKILDLSGNNLSGPVPPYLLSGNGYALRMLNLRGNHFTGTWPDEMGESCSLEVVDLNGNQIRGRLPRSLDRCKSLRHLDVGRNKFVDVFPSWLGNLPYLWLLVLRSNQFYGHLTMPGGNNHSVENRYFSRLQIVDIAGNRLNGALPYEFFNVLKSMIHPQMNFDNIYTHLTTRLDKRDIGIDPYALINVPAEEVQVSMKQLYLSVNKIIDDLVVIDLSDNRFSGCIPKIIGNLTALHVLNLSHNTLSGNIPAEFGQLSNVESLDLSWNNLTGSIPPAMASLTNLEVLNLSYNDLRGNIPTGRQFSTFPSSSFQGGNQGLYGCPLPIRCNLRQPVPAASAPAPPASATAMNQSFEAVILWLFVGSGYGISIAVSIVLQMARCGRHMNDRLEKIASCIA